MCSRTVIKGTNQIRLRITNQINIMLQLVFVTVLSDIIYSYIIQFITKLILIFTVNLFHSSIIIILLFININIKYVRWHNKMSEYYSDNGLKRKVCNSLCK